MCVLYNFFIKTCGELMFSLLPDKYRALSLMGSIMLYFGSFKVNYFVILLKMFRKSHWIKKNSFILSSKT